MLMGLKRQIVLQIGFRCFPNEISPMAISQVRISYVATSQIINFPSGKSKRPSEAPKLPWGRALLLGWVKEAERYGYNSIGGRALRLVQNWEVATWEIAYLES